MKKTVFLLTVLFFMAQAGLMANKTSVEIKAPAEIKKGTEVTLIISVFHVGNSKMHHTDWVVLKINDKEVKKWQYDKSNLPADGNFVLEYKYVASEDITLEAEGHCNIHGSAGPKQTTIKII